MSLFTEHSIESAPEKSKAMLEAAEKDMGFVPNLYKFMAESPASLEAYFKVTEILEKSSLSAKQQQIVLLAISRENSCEFCVAAHSMIGTMMAKVDKSVIDAIRDGQSTGDDKTDALITFSVKLIQQRGWVSDSDKKSFFDAGFTEENALDVVLAASLKTLSNYTNHITGTKTNDEMKEFAWTKS